jgi:hypothetical protein
MQPRRAAAAGLLRLLAVQADSQQLLAPACAAAGAAQWRGFASPPAGPSVPPAATSQDVSQSWYNRQRQTIPLGNRVPDAAVGTYVSPSAVIVGDVDLLDRVRVLAGGGGVARRCGGRRCGGRAAPLRVRRPRQTPCARVERPGKRLWQRPRAAVLARRPCRHPPSLSATRPPAQTPAQASVWNHVVLRGDLNNITIGHVSNIQDRTVIHAARWAGRPVARGGASSRRQAEGAVAMPRRRSAPLEARLVRLALLRLAEAPAVPA